METIDFSDLPKQSSLTLIQKSKAVKEAVKYQEKGLSKKDAISKALGLVQVQKSAATADEKISYEIIYEPDTPDAHGQWMSKETLVKAQAEFKKAQELGAVTENLYHLFDTNVFTIVDHWIQPEFDVNVSETGEFIKAGSWVAKVQYNTDEVWELKKAEIVGGLSLQCGGMLNEETGELYDLNFDISLEDEE